jgi:hypothetical protein
MTAMRSICRAALLVVVTLGALAACATPPRPFTDEFYTPLRVRRDAAARTPVAVFGFADERPDTDPTLVVRYEPLDGRPRVERSTAPVGEGVARAFVRGLQARGFTVADATTRRYAPGEPAPARIVTGRVAEFGVRIARTGFLGGYQHRVACRVAVDVYEPTTGRRLAERSYQRVVEGAMMPAEPLSILSRALADVVEQAVADPELLRALRQ